jgi:hypothetical protein
MKTQTIIDMEILANGSTFAGKVATTVLATKKFSYKQFEIMHKEICIDLGELNDYCSNNATSTDFVDSIATKEKALFLNR